jgi:hypothetical protein
MSECCFVIGEYVLIGIDSEHSIEIERVYLSHVIIGRREGGVSSVFHLSMAIPQYNVNAINGRPRPLPTHF